MKSIIEKLSHGLLLVPALVLGLSFVPVPAYAVTDGTCDETDISFSEGADCARGEDQATNLFGTGGIFATITNVLLFLIGAISVIMLIIGGIRYVVSGGDQAQVTGAKNTILYAIIGIIVAFLAYAAVRFVTNSLSAS